MISLLQFRLEKYGQKKNQNLNSVPLEDSHVPSQITMFNTRLQKET